jgi:glycosyltransferase involved in cell wall biosynthesis
VIICHVITAFGFGGAEKLLVDLVNIQSENNKVHIVYFKGEPLLKSMLTRQVDFHNINLDFHCSSRLRKLLKSLKPDVVHTHLGHADLIGLWACRGLKLKRFCTMHNIWFKWNWKDRLIFIVYSILFKTVARNCTVIAISKSVFEHVEKVLNVSKKNIQLIYNAIPEIGVKADKKEMRKELNIPEDSFCVLFVGRLEIQKSVPTLLHAAKELKGKIKNLRIVIVGQGTLKDELQSLSLELNISDVVFFVGTTSSVEKYFSASDVFTLPSVFEGFGIVIIEAFRASLPVIASNIEGPKEIISNGINGLLFAPKDHLALSRLILKLYESTKLRSTIGVEGYKSYLNNYDINTYARQIETLYLK